MTTYYVQQSSVPSASSTYVPPDAYRDDDAELNEIIEHHYQLSRIQPEKEEAVENFLRLMHWLLDSNEELSGCELEIFGSLKNGFGSNEGDVDMSLRWPHADTLQKWEKVCVLKKVLSVLCQAGCYEVTDVFSARVPIIKFHFFDSLTGIELDCDISVNNELALKNTALLRQYCDWEPHRLTRLGSYIKKWAKIHKIGSAASGTLSSYVYSLMTIHYLQNCSPPVLPRLQEEFRSNADKRETIEDCDVYFAKMVMRGWTRNRKSVAELFKGFLEYYANFDFHNMVVQTRSRNPLLKKTKNWNSFFAVEDPFITSYNLGGYARESARILETFKLSWEVYSKPFKQYRQEMEDQCGNQRKSSIILQELLNSKINCLLSESTEETKTTGTMKSLKRTAISSMTSPRYEKQPLWIPPVQQPITIGFVPSTEFYYNSPCTYY